LSNNDEGCLVVGYTESYGRGNKDIWVLDIDENGEKIWDNTFGGTGEDTAKAIIETVDNNYLIAGSTTSYGLGKSDVWLIKIDNNGNEIWNKTHGSSEWDEGAAIAKAEGEGYIIIGSTSSYGAGEDDIWVIKINESGFEMWNKTFGGKKVDIGRSIDDTQNGFIIGGITSSYGTGGDDMWLIKINEEGDEQWNKTFGAENNEICNQVISTSHNDILLVGHVIFENNKWNAIVVNTDINGEKRWEKIFEKNVETGFSSCAETTNGYIISGHKGSYGDQQDLMIVIMDTKGNIVCEHVLDKKHGNAGVWINNYKDSEYYITGYNDKNGNGLNDLWLLKIKIND